MASNVWLGIAEAQWQYGYTDQEVMNQVKSIAYEGIGQELWQEAGERDYVKRMKALEEFYRKIQVPKAKPKKRKKRIIRKPKFKKGDCLAIQLCNGRYAAALVLDEDTSNQEYPENKIVTLHYYKDKPPSIEDFERCKYLVLTHHNWNNRVDVAYYGTVMFKPIKDKISVIANIDVSERPELDCSMYAPWIDFGDQARLELDEKARGLPV